MKEWHDHKFLSKTASRTTQGSKISLKRVRVSTQGSQHTENSSTCNYSVHSTSKKKSIKDLLSMSTTKSGMNQYCSSMNYEDIRMQIVKHNNLFTNIFCSQKQVKQVQGCNCQPKCIWMNHWLNLSSRSQNCNYAYPVRKQIDQQIRKDILRTQPDTVEFQYINYQQALYKCLIAYACIDPQVAYVQGMNIICSVIIYHGNDLGQCINIFKFFMIGCRFRELLLGKFEIAYKISNYLQECLKLRCYDIYRHMILQVETNLTMFTIGWLIPLMGNIVPLPHMHLVLNIFMEKGWTGIIKVLISMLLYLKNQILAIEDQSQLMHMFSTQKLKNRGINWEQVIRSSSNIKNLPPFVL